MFASISRIASTTRSSAVAMVRIESHFAGPQPAEQAFGGMGDRLELDQPHESGRSLDAVQRAEDLGERTLFGGILLERDQIGIEQRQVLVRLQQELAEDFVVRHGRSFAPASRRLHDANSALLVVSAGEARHSRLEERPGVTHQNNESKSGPTTLAGNAFSTMATTPNFRTGSSTRGSVSVVTIMIGIAAVAGFCFK